MQSMGLIAGCRRWISGAGRLRECGKTEWPGGEDYEAGRMVWHGAHNDNE
jgi:hypothetical protein